MSDGFQRSLRLLPNNGCMTERALHYAGAMTRQRDRVQLMARLTEAMANVLDARVVRLYRLFSPPGARLVGLSVSAEGGGMHIYDDNVSWPEGTGPIDHFPALRACLRNGIMQSDRDESGCHYVFPIFHDESECFGFLDIRRKDSLNDQDRLMLDGLLRIFGNCVGLLDYSEMDTLTGLLNRKIFDDSLVKVLSRLTAADDAEEDDIPVTQRRHWRPARNNHWLGVIDIDHFKLINDSFGHSVGDEALVTLANMMRKSFRVEDKLFRFGGEEFVVLLMPTEAENAFATFDRFRREVEVMRFPQVGQMTVSVGFACIRPQDSPSVILDNADEAMYWAKLHGRNQVCSYEELVSYGMLKKKPPPFGGGLEMRKTVQGKTQ